MQEANPSRAVRLESGEGGRPHACARIIPTHTVFNQTLDEPAHVAAGTEWIQGQYTCEAPYPPLARVAVAAGPFLDGLRSMGRKTIWQEGNAILEGDAILYVRDTYDRKGRVAPGGRPLHDAPSRRWRMPASPRPTRR